MTALAVSAAPFLFSAMIASAALIFMSSTPGIWKGIGAAWGPLLVMATIAGGFLSWL
jgi:hypothetical protein